jgi:hypothetical protein
MPLLILNALRKRRLVYLQTLFLNPRKDMIDFKTFFGFMTAFTWTLLFILLVTGNNNC